MNPQNSRITLSQLSPLFDDVAEAARGALIGWSARTWTREIKGRLSALAEANGCDVCASNCSGAKWPEWLYDITWLRSNIKGAERYIDVIDSPLVGECEWKTGIGEIRQDFQKLLLARADLRLMIFEAKTSEWATKITDELIEQIRSYVRSAAGDRYVFACFVSQTRGFTCAEYVHENGAQVT